MTTPVLDTLGTSSSTDCTVRPAMQDDLPGILELRDACSGDTTQGGVPYLKPLSPEETAELLPNTLVCESRGRLLAVMHWKPLFGEYALMGGLAVSPEARGKGIAPKLIEHMLNAVLEKNRVCLSFSASTKVQEHFSTFNGQELNEEWQLFLRDACAERYGEEKDLLIGFRFSGP